MNCYLLFFFSLFFFLHSGAQKREQFYDYNWKPCNAAQARFVSYVEKTDSGWIRRDYFLATNALQMEMLYADSVCKIQNGYGHWFHSNGRLSAAGRYKNNKREGLCVSYHANGMLSDSAWYENGKIKGIGMSWYADGSASDSLTSINDSTTVAVSWHIKGAPSAAGYLRHNKPQGKWRYFHEDGSLSAEVQYEKGRIISKAYFNPDGSVQPDTADTDAVFKNGGPAGWRKYLEKSMYWPTNVKLVNTDMVTVVVQFEVNTEGKTELVELYTPFEPRFDAIALKVIKNSPAWIPARQFNRPVRVKRRQPLSFAQME